MLRCHLAWPIFKTAVGCVPLMAEDALELLADMCEMDPRAARAPKGCETCVRGASHFETRQLVSFFLR